MYFRISLTNDIKNLEKFPFYSPHGKADDTHLFRYQGLATEDYGFTLDAPNTGHPRLSIIKDKTLTCFNHRIETQI
jgi:hypothetical protein